MSFCRLCHALTDLQWSASDLHKRRVVSVVEYFTLTHVTPDPQCGQVNGQVVPLALKYIQC